VLWVVGDSNHSTMSTCAWFQISHVQYDSPGRDDRSHHPLKGEWASTRGVKSAWGAVSGLIP